MLERLLVQEFIGIPAPTIRRSLYLSVGGLDEQLSQTADWDLYLKLTSAGDVYYRPESLACFRIHQNSLTMSNSRCDDYRTQLQIVLDRHIGRVKRGRDKTLRMAEASIAINIGLAAAANGRPGQILKSTGAFLALGPRAGMKYIAYSRIFERAYPRLRARLAGSL